ncbi:MAG: methylaspartate ammonia-lyase, partial [Spirochaetota bacterium]
DQRYTGVDKMILKKVDVLPHGLINDINTKLGTDGGKLLEYLNWVCRRIKEIRARASYQPVIHIDVYGTIGIIFSHNLEKIVNYLLKLEKAAGEFQVYIEGPVDMEEKGPQIEFLGKIKKALEKHSSGLKIVADEWCNSLEDIKDFAASRCCHMVQIKTPDLGGIQNTVESILFCKNAGVEAYQGGSCNETDMSSRVCVHVAMAARPDRLLAKPGMGFDEGYSIVNNEMQRIITVLRDKYPHQ